MTRIFDATRHSESLIAYASASKIIGTGLMFNSWRLFAAFFVVATLHFTAHAAQAWHLTIPLPGTYTVPSGSVFTREPSIHGTVETAGVFSDPTATINYMKITYTDDSGGAGRNYDCEAIVSPLNTLDRGTGFSGKIGAGQIGRYNDIYPSPFTFIAQKDFDTGVFSENEPGNGTGEDSGVNNPVTFGANGMLYARVTYFRGDGGTGPTVSNIKLQMTMTCSAMPGAVLLGGNQSTISWQPSRADEAVAQKLYRATSASGPFALLQAFANNTTASFNDTTFVNGTTYYYKVVAEAAGGVVGSDSNVVSVNTTTLS